MLKTNLIDAKTEMIDERLQKKMRGRPLGVLRKKKIVKFLTKQKKH